MVGCGYLVFCGLLVCGWCMFTDGYDGLVVCLFCGLFVFVGLRVAQVVWCLLVCLRLFGGYLMLRVTGGWGLF